jgi:hypothetical protein
VRWERAYNEICVPVRDFGVIVGCSLADDGFTSLLVQLALDIGPVGVYTRC